MEKERSLIVLARYPEYGKVKSRLAKKLGKQKSLEVYTQLFSNTAKVCAAIDAQKYLFLRGLGDPQYHGYSNFEIHPQLNLDLGTEMKHAMHAMIDTSLCVLIGTDIYDIEANDIEEAFERLASSDVVLGPASDGGYYLIGWRKKCSFLFEGIEWSMESVLAKSCEMLRLNKFSYSLLNVRNDLDTFADYQAYMRFILKKN